VSGYFARLAQRSGIDAAAAARPAPDAAAAPVMPLEQSIEIAAPPSERPATATLVADARPAAPRRTRLPAAVEQGAELAGAPQVEQSEGAQRPLGPESARPAGRLPAEPAPSPEAWRAPATATSDSSASRFVDDQPTATVHPAPTAEPAAASRPLDVAPAARHVFTSRRQANDPAPPAASGPVEVRIGTITLRVQPPSAAPPVRPAAPQRADRFSPHRHYLRGW
jgi:hypothetical protein